MKKEATNQLQQGNVRFISPSRLILAAGSAVLLTLTPLAELQAQPNGMISGSTASAYVGDDLITVSTLNVTYFTSCYFIANGLSSNAAFGNNYVFAGQGPASGIANISPSDFTVSGNGPWIGTSTPNFNAITLPSGDKIVADKINGAGINNAEAGGMGILISYTPKNGDPTSINFMQAYIENINGTGFSSGTIDGASGNLPFYNAGSAGGTGTTYRGITTNGPGTSPLVTSGTVPGWIGDQPYDNEFGPPGGPADDTVTNTTVTFQTFISSVMNIGGTNYNVMVGGIQWGYSFSTIDMVPEPGTVALATTGALAAGLLRRYQRRGARNRKG
jgi:hypothetical protein